MAAFGGPAEYFADDAVRVLPGPKQSTTERGRRAIGRHFRRTGVKGYRSFAFETEAVDGSGDLAFRLDKFELTADMRWSEDRIEPTGWWLSVLRKQADGNWKVVVDFVVNDHEGACA